MERYFVLALALATISKAVKQLSILTFRRRRCEISRSLFDSSTKDLHIPALIDQYQGLGNLDNCDVVKEYR